ncbi:MAG: MmgE/PrpD family protein [Candidatus Dormibacteraceae bacterium]
MNTIASELARQLSGLHQQRLGTAPLREAERSLLNVLATAIGASRESAVDIVLAVGRAVGGRAEFPVPGRAERADRHHAALATGIAAHIDDFDDTHLATVIHPGAACLAAGLATAVQERANGAHFLSAFALGIEAQLRVGLAMSPTHYDEGWHITGTVGGIGAAVTTGLLLGLKPDRLAIAIALAACQPIGHRESFGTMEKSFHPGKAGANGMLAALLAQAGQDADLEALEGPGGFFQLLSGESRPDTVIAGLGERWELLSNTYKPYPCGIVCHPAIDAAVTLSAEIRGAALKSVTVHCNPLVAELTGNPAPTDGLEARFSTIHGVAAGLADGTVGLPQYADGRVTADDLVRLRALTVLAPDPRIPRAAARVVVELSDGRRLVEAVTNARGSLERPLTDPELEEKANGLIEPVLPGRTRSVVEAVVALRQGGSISGLVAAATPEVAA